MPNLKITELMLYMRNFEREASDHLENLVHNQRQNEIGRREFMDQTLRTMSGGALTKAEQAARSAGNNTAAYNKAKHGIEELREDLQSSPAVKTTIAALTGAAEARGLVFESKIEEARSHKEMASELLKGLTTLRERGVSSIDLAQDISALKSKDEVLSTMNDAVMPFLQPEEEPGMGPDNDYNPKPQPRNRPAPTIDM